MMDFSGLPDQEQPETGGDLLSGLPDTNAGTLRKQYRSTALAPDMAAKVMDLSAKSGLPRVTVERNQLFAERKASEPDWDALESTAPVTARTLAANANMFEIAHDDTENLSNIEKAFGTLSRHVKGIAGSLSAGVLNDTNAAVWGWLEGGAKALGANKTGDYFKAFRKEQEGQAVAVQGGYGEAGFAEASVASGVRSLGAMASGLVAAVMTGNPAFSLGMGSGQAGGQTVGKGLDAGVSPVQSLVYGAEDATAEWATEMLPMGLLIRDLKLGAPLYKILARQIATEVPTEIAATAWQNFNEWANVNPEMPFSGYLEKLGPDEALTISSTIVQTVLSAGLAKGTSKILQRATAQQDQADSAMKSAASLAQLAKLAAESKPRGRGERGVQAFQAFVEAVTEEGGVQDVYLDTNTLLQAGVDLDALAKLSPVAAEQLKQPNIGGDLVIPASEYLARIAGSEVDTLLAPHLRTGEDQLSATEAQIFYQNRGEEFAKAAQQVMEEKANDTAWTDSAKVVETQLFDQLQQTGRFTADANKIYALLMKDFYVATAGKLGLTPEEMALRYQLIPTNESKAGGKTMEYGQPDTEAFKNWFGGSKVVDAEGKPLVVYHGTIMEFDAFDSEKSKDFGIHFGTKEQSTNATRKTWGAKEIAENSRTIPVFLQISNPLEIDFDPTIFGTEDYYQEGNYHNEILKKVLFAATGRTSAWYAGAAEKLKTTLDSAFGAADKADNAASEFLENDDIRGLGGSVELTAFHKNLGKLIEAYGFDGVFYENEIEGDGLSYIVFSPNQIKSAIGNQGTYDPNDTNILHQNALDPGQFFQGPQHRGEITLADDITQQPTFLSLLKNANLSTFLHEMGHFQLEVLSHIASQPNAPVEIVQDMERVLEWFGITGSEEVGGGGTAGQLGQPVIPPNVEADALVAAREVQNEMDAFDLAKEVRSLQEGGWVDLSSLVDDPRYYDAESEEFTAGGLAEVDRLTEEKARDNLRLGSLDDVSDLDNAHHWAQYAAMIKILDGMGIEYQDTSAAQSKYIEVNGYKLRFANHANQVRDSAVRGSLPVVNVAPGESKFSDALRVALGASYAQGDDATQPDVTNLPTGRTPLEVWQAMSLEEKRPFHEQFARGFEAYLFEGKAPSVELNATFARLRSWLINVYKSVVNLRVEINDDIRGVFDRLLATESAIKQTEEMRAYGALYTSAEQMGMDAEGWAEYQRTDAEATDEAMTALQKRSLRDMQWLTNARNRTLKKLQQEAKAKRNAVQEEVTAEVQEMPLYAALRFIRQGEGNNITKLSLPDLKEMYGEEPAAPWRYLPVGLAANEGLAPDHIAELFGFTSGDHLVRAILEQSSEKDMIEGLTDQRMLERYGDLNSPDALSRAADEAIHNAARARFVATELKALDKANTPARVIVQAAKAFAEAMIARKKVREIRPIQHAAAEVRAGKNVLKALANGDNRLAAIEKRNQLIQNLSTKEAYNALGEIEKAVRYLRKFDKEGPRKSIDVGYLDQIDQLLERFDFRASITNKAAKKRESLLAWLEEQRLQGFEPDIPQELQTEALRKPYRELTMEELRGLIDTVKQIEHLGRLKRKLLTSKDAREFQAIRDEIAASIEEHAKKTVDLRTRSNTAEALKSGGKHFLAMHRKMASLARELDGFKDGGPMWEYFIRSMNTAGDTETTKRGDATARLFELVKPLLGGGKMGGKGRYFETLQGSFNREERIAIALNLGNAGNTQRLLDGEGWSMAQLRPLLDTITPEEAAFVQNIWDFFESYRPEIAAKERRVYGKEPNWVEPTPITLGGQQLRGGYYPIQYDANRTGKAEQFAAAEEAKAQMKGAFTSSTTRRSFAKTRAEEVVGRPLVYSFSGLYLGANEVIHDLAWHEWLIDANRLVRSLDGVIRLHYGPEGVAVFKKGVEDIAAGDAGAANAFEKGLNHIRTGATIAGLGWNLTTSLFQPLGLLPSMVRVGPGWMAKGIGQFLANPKRVSEEIVAKDPMMADRAKTMQREINEIQNQIQASKLDPIRSTFFVLIQKAQWLADAPTWLGAYEKAVAEGNEEERAVALARQAVLDSQGGGQTKDLAQIQRGGPLLKLWTNFYSYFNTVYNLGAEKTNEKIGSPKLYPSLALDYLLLYIAPAALVTILRDALSGGDDDDLVKKLLADQISSITGLMIGLREVTTAMQKVAGVEQYKGSYGGPAGLRLFQELDKLGQQVGQGEADEALFRAINNVGGIVFHYPSGQVARTVGGAAAMFEGKTENPAALVLGPPRK